MRTRFDIESWRVVQQVNYRHTWRGLYQHGFDLADVDIIGTEIGEKNYQDCYLTELSTAFNSRLREECLGKRTSESSARPPVGFEQALHKSPTFPDRQNKHTTRYR